MVYKWYKKRYGFTKDKMIHAFWDDIKNGVNDGWSKQRK